MAIRHYALLPSPFIHQSNDYFSDRLLAGARKFFWTKGEGRPTLYGLWRLAQAVKRGATDLFLVEGETDALTLWLHSLEALGVPGADMCSLLLAPHVAGFRRMFIVRENDRGGEVFEKGCVGRLAELEYRGEVRVVDMARANAKDPNDLHIRFLSQSDTFDSEFRALIELARPVELPIVGIEFFNASDIQERSLRWLWTGRVPRGKLILFAGDAGLGKSFVSLAIVACLSTGRNWPDGSPNGIVARSIIFSAEDGMADTIKPRLIELGADVNHIGIVKRVKQLNEAGEIVRRGFNLAVDLPKLEHLLDRYPDVQFVVVDPVSAYLGRGDSYKNSEMRSEVLDPLAELAERRDVTILAVTHFNKGSGNALNRVSGSVAFPAAARVVWGFAKDPTDPGPNGRRLMLFGKSNVGPEMPGLAYRIVGTDNGRATIIWVAGEVNQNLNDVLRQEQEEQKGDKLSQACDLIRKLCVDGPVPTIDLESRARELGIGEWSLNKARTVLGCKSVREGGIAGKGRWMVKLP